MSFLRVKPLILLDDIIQAYSMLLVFLKHLANQVFGLLSYLPPALLIKVNLSVHNIEDTLLGVFMQEGKPTCQQGIDYDPETPNVSSLVIGSPCNYLWRHYYNATCSIIQCLAI